MKRMIHLAAISSLVAGCAASPGPSGSKPVVDRPASHTPMVARGLESVLGKDANMLKRLFGEPRLDVVEVNGRKLQFSGRACILDAYLYPKGGREIVTYIDARRNDGAEVDRVACVNALRRR